MEQRTTPGKETRKTALSGLLCALGAAVISLAGMIVMAAYLLAKRKSLLTQA